MANFQIRFPKLCAWCGTRQPSATRKVNVVLTQGRRTSSLSFDAPICEKCQAYAAGVQTTTRQRQWAAVIGSFVVSILLSLLIFGKELELVMGIFLGFVLMIVALIVISRPKMEKQITQRMVGEPPEAYASRDWQPCAMSGARTLMFFSDKYQAQFAILNPELVVKP